MGKTVAYIRVSTDDQQAQGTLENQRDAINAFSKARGIKVDEWLPETQSGADSDRPEFQKLSQGVLEGLYSTVIVAAQDRLSRSPLHTLQFIEHIQKGKATLYIIRENIGISDGKADLASEILINMISVFAKNERETIRMRTMEGKQRKQKSGKWVTGQAPLGYELDRQTKILKVNKAEADTVQLVFNLRMEGLGTLSIVKELNATKDPLYERRYEFKRSRYCKVSQKQRRAGYCRVRHFHEDYQGCPQCAHENGGVNITGISWSPTLIKKVLKNRVYLGEIKIAGKWITAAHKQIIDKTTFDTVQEILQNSYHRPLQSNPHSPLSGLVFCGCGSRMYATTANGHLSKITGKLGKKYAAFTCPRRKVGQCAQANVPTMKLTNIVFNRVNELIQSPETAKIIKEAYDKFIDKSKNTTPDIKEPKRELQDITQALKRLTRAYGHLIESGVADDTLNEMSDNITVLDQRKKAVRNRIEFLELRDTNLKDVLDTLDPESVMKLVRVTMEFLSEQPIKAAELTGRIFRAFVKRVEVKGADVHVVSHFDEHLLEGPLQNLLQGVLFFQTFLKSVWNPNADGQHIPITLEEDTTFS